MNHRRRCAGHAAWAALALVAVLAAACQAQRGPVDPGASAAVPGQADEATLRTRINAEIGDARCSSDNQCRTLALGAKACGGPQGWVAWSTAVSGEDRLQALARALAQRQRARHEGAGIVSDCRVQPDPGAECRAQRCTLRDLDLPALRPANTR